MSRRAGTPTAKKVTQLVNVEEHVEGFRQVREAHRRELMDALTFTPFLIFTRMVASKYGRPLQFERRHQVLRWQLCRRHPVAVYTAQQVTWCSKAALSSSKSSRWCWASVRKSPVATRKAWSTMLVKRRWMPFVCLPRNTVRNEPAFFTHAARRSFFSVINSV